VSLAIDVKKVAAVLLVDGWHDVTKDSFTIDAYEYLWRRSTDPDVDPFVSSGGDGFEFKDAKTRSFLMGPLTAIHAVRMHD
jgi:hypothetical protein